MKKKFTEFIKQNIDAAYRFAYIYVKNQQDAEDVVSESTVRALRSLKLLKDSTAMKSWFYSIIVNTAKTLLSKRSKTVFVDNDILENISDETPDYFDDYSDLDFNEIIEKLHPDNRIIIVLRFYEGYKLREIAEILDLNENTVKKRLYSSLKILRDDMEV